MRLPQKRFIRGLIIAGALLLGICFTISYRIRDTAENPLYSLTEFEKNVLNGKEYAQFSLANGILYTAYEPSYPSVYLYLLEKKADGQYAIAAEAGGIGYTIDDGKSVAASFRFQPLQMDMIFVPTPIDLHKGYREIVFSDGYLYISEDYSLVYPISGPTQRR